MPASVSTGATGARLAAESREGAVRERFVREVLTHVPLARLAELHLFAPMRQGGVESGVAVVVAVPPDTPSDRPRHTVYTARYRLTVRGPDRGRWQVDVRADADAPLLTVDAVVRGVQRRAGDASPPVRLDADAVERLAGPVGLAPTGVAPAGAPGAAG